MTKHYLHTYDPQSLGNMFLGLSNVTLGGLPAAPAIVESALDAMVEGAAFSQQLTVTGGTGNISWSYTGTVPTGITISATGLVSGTPTVADQAYDIDMVATDASGRVDTVMFTGSVASAGDWTQITFELEMNTDSDGIFEADDASDACETDGDNVVRIYPGVRPSTLDYFKDFSSTYPTYRTAPNGINGAIAVRLIDSSAVLREQDAIGTFTLADLAELDSCVFAIAGKITTHDITTAEHALVGMGGTNDTNGVPRLLSEIDGTLQVNMSGQIMPVTPAAGLFSIVVWKRAGTIDWWANRVKQTQKTSVADFGALTGDVFSINGAADTDWMIRHLKIAKSHATEGDIEDLANYLCDSVGLA